MTDRTERAILPGEAISSPWRRRVAAIGAGSAAVLGAAAIAAPPWGRSPWTATLGQSLAMAAAAMFMIQLLLTARIAWLDGALGLDRLYRAHAIVGISAAVLISAHPLLVYWGGVQPAAEAAGETRRAEWGELAGAAVLCLVWVVICTSVWREFLGLSYEAWRWTHRLTFVIVIAGLAHAFSVGSDLAAGSAGRWIWVFAGAAYVGAALWLKLIRPIVGRRRFVVASVTRPGGDTVSVELKPEDDRPFAYLPGQFVFVKFHSREVSGQMHPFTISSTPTRGQSISLTIKQCGDFTNTLPRLRAGDRAAVEGPFGRFSHLLLSRAHQPLVMIAGGIGIAPMLSMLRWLGDTSDNRPIKLIWSNKTQADVVYPAEFDELQRHLANLKVRHVLTRQENPAGRHARIDRQLLDELLTQTDRDGLFLVCGPAGMTAAVRRCLRSLGVRPARIRSERFRL